MENGTQEKKQAPSILADFLDVLSDHAELATVELSYEAGVAGKFVLAAIGALVLAIMAFVLLQAAIVFGLVRLGIPLWLSCIILAALYLVAAVIVVYTFCRRDSRAGSPFEGTRRELRATTQWIRSLLS